MENRKYKKHIDKEKQAAIDKDKYLMRKNAGMCVVCGKKQSEYGLKCGRCYAKIRARSAKRKSDIQRSERPAYGLCYICGKPKMSDKNVCEKCYKTRMESISNIMHLPVSEYWKEQEYIRHEYINNYNNVIKKKGGS